MWFEYRESMAAGKEHMRPVGPAASVLKELRVNWQWGQSMPLKERPNDPLPPPKLCLLKISSSPKVTSWRPSVQTQEPLEDVSDPNTIGDHDHAFLSPSFQEEKVFSPALESGLICINTGQ